MPWPKLIQVFLGSTLGIAILLGGAVGVGFLLVRQFSALPPRPVFENDFPSPSPSAVVASPTLTPTPTPVPSPAELEPGAYRAVVAYPSGLAVRELPSVEANQVGGVDFQQRVVVLETSGDQDWQRIRTESGELQGWVKAGNIEKLEE